MAVEEITLPADPEARLQAELAQSQTRLAEAVDASARGDENALEASLEAYGRVIAALGSETGAGAERALEAVRAHRSVLQSVLDGAPAAAAAGLDLAIARSETLIERLEDTLASDTGPGGAGGGNQGGQAEPRPTREPKPEATPRPTREPKPEATPRPTREPKPEATPKAERTPKPRPTPNPPGQDDARREVSSP